jgi:hypothetical protein
VKRPAREARVGIQFVGIAPTARGKLMGDFSTGNFLNGSEQGADRGSPARSQVKSDKLTSACQIFQRFDVRAAG